MPETDTPITNITDEHRKAFDALRSPDYTNFGLFSCFLNGEPTCAIIAINQGEDGLFQLSPLFVAVTPSMVLKDHDGAESKEH